jgi:hypothetical protein
MTIPQSKPETEIDDYSSHPVQKTEFDSCSTFIIEIEIESLIAKR